MNRRNRIGVALFLAVLPGVGDGEPGIEPIKTTVCELMKHPKRYAGRFVEFRATVDGGFESSTLADRNCSIWFAIDRGGMTEAGGTEYAEIDKPKDADRPDRLRWLPIRKEVVLVKDSSYERYASYLSNEYRPKTSQILCLPCPLYTVTATFIGRFDYSSKEFVVVRDQSKKVLGVGPSGFGHLNGWPSQFVLQSVRDASAEPVKAWYTQ